MYNINIVIVYPKVQKMSTMNMNTVLMTIKSQLN